ncbi:hypothetical protein KEM48_005458 [Puccinia striiformis f. sp. tritici PST-130]|nr:hypothetical protein KEM48_005458 [Puccinia striiformis f. sp. tritici PST-130]
MIMFLGPVASVPASYGDTHGNAPLAGISQISIPPEAPDLFHSQDAHQVTSIAEQPQKSVTDLASSSCNQGLSESVDLESGTTHAYTPQGSSKGSSSRREALPPHDENLVEVPNEVEAERLYTIWRPIAHCTTCDTSLPDGGKVMRWMNCGHEFHQDCHDQYSTYNQAHHLPVTCPICRRSLSGKLQSDQRISLWPGQRISRNSRCCATCSRAWWCGLISIMLSVIALPLVIIAANNAAH